MNRKKIYKILSSTLSSLYLINSTSVFAFNLDETNLNQETISTVESNNELDLCENKESSDTKETLANNNDSSENISNENTSNDLTNTNNDSDNDNNLNEEIVTIDTTVEETINDITDTSNTNETTNIIENIQSENINQKSTDVTFDDINLLRAVNKALSKGDVDTPVTIDEMATLNSLDISRLNITSLVGLEYAVNLSVLTANNNSISDLTPISNLTSLTQLNLQGNPKFNLEQFNKLSNLENLISLVIAIDAPEANLTIGANALFPNIQQFNIGNSSINSLTVTDANALSYLVNESCNINTLSINNANASSISLEKGIFKNITIENCNKLSSISASYTEFENLYVGDCSSFAYIALTNSKPNNMTFKNVPLTAGISLYNASMGDLILDSISAQSNVTASSCSINNLQIIDTNLSTLNISSSTIQNIKLSNLIYFNNFNCSYSTITELVMDNCPNIRSISASGAKLPNIDFSTLTLLTSLDLGGAEMDTVNIANLTNLSSANLMNAKINNLHLDNLNAISMLGLIGGTFEDTSISNMPNLKSLGINNIATKFLSVENCDNLTSLDGIPKTINNLKLSGLNALTSLNLANCGLEGLSIDNCSKLATLNANSNNLISLDGFLVPSITSLNLNNNKIKDISNLKDLTSLQSLSLDNNQISDISHLKEITSLSDTNISVLNQTVSLPDCYSTPGDITLENVSIIDYDGNIVPVTQVPSGGSITPDSVILGQYTEGVYDENIELSSNQIKYSVTAAQKIIVDGTAPTLIVTANTNEYTTENIFLTVEAEDALTGLDYIKLPNGTIIKDSTFEFEVDKNGDYDFEAVDLVGNSIKQTINISNIDTEAPIVKTSVSYNDDSTEATLTIEATDSLSGVLNITLPDGQVVESDTTSFIITKNGDYIIEVRDAVGNIYTETISIDSIKDKVSSDDNTNNDNKDDNNSNNNTDSDKDDTINKPTDNITDNNDKTPTTDNDNTNNNETDTNIDKIPNSSGLGVFATIVAMMSLAIGAISFKKKK